MRDTACPFNSNISALCIYLITLPQGYRAGRSPLQWCLPVSVGFVQTVHAVTLMWCYVHWMSMTHAKVYEASEGTGGVAVASNDTCTHYSAATYTARLSIWLAFCTWYTLVLYSPVTTILLVHVYILSPCPVLLQDILWAELTSPGDWNDAVFRCSPPPRLHQLWPQAPPEGQWGYYTALRGSSSPLFVLYFNDN